MQTSRVPLTCPGWILSCHAPSRRHVERCRLNRASRCLGCPWRSGSSRCTLGHRTRSHSRSAAERRSSRNRPVRNIFLRSTVDAGPTSPTTSSRYARPSASGVRNTFRCISGLLGIQTTPPDIAVEPSELVLLLEHDRVERGVGRGQCRHESAASASNDHEIERLVPCGHCASLFAPLPLACSATHQVARASVSTTKSCHRPSTPLRTWCPRSWERDPGTGDEVDDVSSTRISPGSALATAGQGDLRRQCPTITSSHGLDLPGVQPGPDLQPDRVQRTYGSPTRSRSPGPARRTSPGTRRPRSRPSRPGSPRTPHGRPRLWSLSTAAPTLVATPWPTGSSRRCR